jgi:4-amino-4-deoxy-L-arabinose transferase-like glycosyltransferase
VELRLRIKGVFKSKRSFAAFLSDNYPLFAILVGAVLVSASIGPFHSVDTQMEFDAVSGVIAWGRPYMTYGEMINQPPLGFYVEALLFSLFGVSYNLGVALITVIGLGCTTLVYTLGKVFYGKSTAILAAAFFALTPWQLALTRSLLIDAQCLFLSMLCLLVGIYAVRKDSFKLFMVSGTLFAAAFLTKFFAVFTLIPLTIFYFYYGGSKLKRASIVVAYFLPVILFVLLWYQVLSGRGLISTMGIDDFTNQNPAGTQTTALFLVKFLSQGLGTLTLVAAALSLAVSFARRKLFAKLIPFDLMCLATIAIVGAINTVLGIGLNLIAPYNNPIKYDYQFLPFFALLAASLVAKCVLLFNEVKQKEKLSKLLFSVAAVGLVLLATAMLLNVNFVNYYSTWDHWLFKVDFNQGYSFVNSTPLVDENSYLLNIQYLGFAFVLSGLMWASRHKIYGPIHGFFKRTRQWIETKNTVSYKRRENSQ